jgi:hypothetical protein
LCLKDKKRGAKVLKYTDYDKDYNKFSQITNKELGGLPILIEEGIIYPDNTLISSGKLLEVARNSQQFVVNKDWKGLHEYLKADDGLDESEQGILQNCVVAKCGGTILDFLLIDID